MVENQENFYWLFSSSAQTISTFGAFLITGYALVLNMLHTIEQKDETYEDIHHKLKQKFYKRLATLVTITGLAVIFSLWMVYLNGEKNDNKSWLYVVTALLNIAAVIVGILFVLLIINPNRYKNIAKEMIKEIDKDNKKTYKVITDTGLSEFEQNETEVDIDQAVFMKEFINLEKQIQKKILKFDSFSKHLNESKKLSLRYYANILFQNDLISYELFQELLDIYKYRNLVFHGHIEKVESKMVYKIKVVSKIIENL